jgi:hypothetical protein
MQNNNNNTNTIDNGATQESNAKEQHKGVRNTNPNQYYKMLNSQKVFICLGIASLGFLDSLH